MEEGRHAYPSHRTHAPDPQRVCAADFAETAGHRSTRRLSAHSGRRGRSGGGPGRYRDDPARDRLLLPIWSALPSDHLVVNRIADQSGQSWLGRIVFDDHVVQLYTKLGLDRAENLPPGDIVKSALGGRSVDDAAVPDGDQARRGERSARIELVGAPPAQLPISNRSAASPRSSATARACSCRWRALPTSLAGCSGQRPERHSHDQARGIRLDFQSRQGWVSSMAASAAWVVAAPALSPACSSN
jgi:hypothetical protein